MPDPPESTPPETTTPEPDTSAAPSRIEATDVHAMRQQIEQLEGQLDQSRQTVEALERRQSIDALLAEADTIDLEAARLLTQIAVAEMDEPDLELAVQDLRQSKPYLFRTPQVTQGSAMSPEVEPHTREIQAADRAAMTGDRRDLLAYLRLKRR